MSSSGSSGSSSSSSSSVGRNSLIMAAGTAASRVTGQVRTILLAAALGTTGLAANAYQAGAMIPQAVFALISGGIFNAVLVPQIVRTLKEHDAEDRLNKLITLVILSLLGITLLMAVATPLLTTLYVDGDANMTALTNAFTLWCIPQVFFYGLYTLLGQILAAKDHFGMYAWSSVGANIISCAGFTAFILLFGKANEQPLDFWTSDKITLTAGTWTLGVAFQALILFLPLMRCGIRYRFRLGISGIGLRSMGSVAGWSIGLVIIDQLANIIATRITTSAPDRAFAAFGIDQSLVAGNATYQNALTLYLLPYSLIAVSVATALFPRISAAIADHDLDSARTVLNQSLRNLFVIMTFFSVAFVVMPVPITLALLPSVSVHEAVLISGPLMAQGISLPLASAYLVIQRTFYAFEDGRNPFRFTLLYDTVHVGFLVAAIRFASPTDWVMLFGASGTIGYLVGFPMLVILIRRRFDGHLGLRRLAVSCGKALAAAVAALVVGLAVRPIIYRMLGILTDGGNGMMGWLQSVLACILLTIVLAGVYVGVLWALRSYELMVVVRMVRQRLGRGEKTVDNPVETAPDAGDTADVLAAADSVSEPGEQSQRTMPRVISSQPELTERAPVLSELPLLPTAPESAARLGRTVASRGAEALGLTATAHSLAQSLPQSAAQAAAQAAQAAAQSAAKQAAQTAVSAMPIVRMTDASHPSEPAQSPIQQPSSLPQQQPRSAAKSQLQPLPQQPLPQQPKPQTAPQAQPNPQPIQPQPQHHGVETMKPQLGDTVINRYTLVSPLRATPGLEAWKANDRVLSRDCQLFIIKDVSVAAKISSTASALALSRDARFTQVLQLQHAAGVEIVVTQLDAGLSLSQYFKGAAGRTLSFDAMRSILGETHDAVVHLFGEGLRHDELNADTVRISVAGVQLADAVLDPMLDNVVAQAVARCGGQDFATLSPEEITIRQLAALLYAMITREPVTGDTVFDLSRLDDVPADLRVICKRGLGLRRDESDTDIPMTSLVEFTALLGSWTPLNQLHEHDIALPGVAGECSIASVALRQTDPNNVHEVPSSVVTAADVPVIGFNDIDLADAALAGGAGSAGSRAGAGVGGAAGAAAGAGIAGAGLRSIDPEATLAGSQMLSGLASGGTLKSWRGGKNRIDAAIKPHTGAGDVADAGLAKLGSGEFGSDAGKNGYSPYPGFEQTQIGHYFDETDSSTGDLFAAFDTGSHQIAGPNTSTIALDVSSVRGSNAIPSSFPPAAAGFAGAVGAGAVGAGAAASGAGSVPNTGASPRSARSVFSNGGNEGNGGNADARAAHQQSGSGVIPAANAAVSAAANANHATNAANASASQPHPQAEQTQIIPPILDAETAQPIPPSFTPNSSTPSRTKVFEEDEIVANEPLFGKMPTKIIAVVIGLVVIIGAGFLAVRGLNGEIPGFGIGGNSENKEWPSEDLNNVPFGSGTAKDSVAEQQAEQQAKEDAAKKQAAESDKNAEKTPDPKHDNTTPLQIASQSFQTNPGGQQGYAYYIRLAKSEEAYRLVVKITTSGGKAYVRTNTTGDPTKGDEVAQFTFKEGGTTEVKFDKVSKTQDIIIWVPIDSLPNNQLYIQSVQVF